MGCGTGSDNPVLSLVWLLILLFVAPFIAGFCAVFYIVCYTIEACIPQVKEISDLFLKGVQFPHICVKNMLAGSSFTVTAV